MSISAISLFGLMALVFILSNVMIYFIFRWIKATKIRNRQIKLAKLARIWMKTHRSFGIIACALITTHIGLFLYINGDFFSIKAFSGLVAVLFFSMVLVTGWFRHKKATGKRRKNHRISAFIFILFLFIHIIV